MLLFFSCAMLFADVTISGMNRPEIVVGKEPSPVVRFAAKELAYFIGRSLGVEIASKESSTAPVRIFLGIAPDGKPVANETWESHIDIQNDGSIYIYGYDFGRWTEQNPTPAYLLFSVKCKGTLEATYQFLEDWWVVLDRCEVAYFIGIALILTFSDSCLVLDGFSASIRIDLYDERNCY